MLGYEGKIQVERLGRGGGLQANFRYMAGLGSAKLRVIGAKPRIVHLGNRALLGARR